MPSTEPKGPLHGVTVVHLASWGPGPYAAMLLADMGCEVIVVDRRSAMITTVPPEQDPRRRSQSSIALDLKDAGDKRQFLQLIQRADVFIEGMRPGAAERLSIGPDQCQQLNSGLIYARMTGWGQTGALADTAGHDINYIALSGALDAMGSAAAGPVIPLNLLGDYGGGGLYLVMGILAALFERQKSGQGQVVDGAIVDGVASLTTATLGMLGVGRWGERGQNLFDGSCPWYSVYRTRDDKWVAVGAIEAAFYRQLLEGLGMDPAAWDRSKKGVQAALREALSDRFRQHDRDHWQRVFQYTDACVTPVLSFSEAMESEHHLSRATYTSLNGIGQPNPGPRLSRTPMRQPAPPPSPDRDREVIAEQFQLFREDGP
ncbi:MAG: CoA transferase [Gammaproteobacteria bacterium]|nr:CoA transferase [Gammaproteobacteria bacterium]